ncbi:uncharacterized protein LOC124135775 isoform X2 [Haliotis rufescens]|uniref:uncharacterized protein LOC124135775 isoform X2 n=1 Tax=Haliotis rufescens TaxID=6454 RepID=UPI00201F1020|nr:uncharacterized protein LOC124135775 isoform X2 [Haliotis rufescens]XP_048251861.1 uncharacterized protein LOC124135775 isoform X2 [Haliotis rufescens]
MKAAATLLRVLTVVCLAAVISGHGRMIEPPNRGSLWRVGYNVAKNYDDNALNCGGYQVQWLLNAGRCGHCGDAYRGPREHERGGKYASDVISRKYTSGQVIDVTIDITANHGGYFQFYLCSQPRLSEACFREHPLYVVGEGYKHKLRTLRSPLFEKVQLQLPRGTSCDHCVLQWRWNCAQSYGMDWETGIYCKGCGQQEQFWNCADIAIEPPLRVPRPFFKKIKPKPERRDINLMDNPVPGILHVPSMKMAHFLPSPPPVVFQQTAGECRGSATYGIALDAWCKLHCPLGFCPPTHCRCT